MNKFKNIFHNAKSFFLLVIAISIIVISSSVYDLTQSRRDLLHLIENQSTTLINTIIYSSRNALLSSGFIEEAIKQKMYDNFNFVNSIYAKNDINSKSFESLIQSNNIFRVNIFDPVGKVIYSNNRFGKFSNKNQFYKIKNYLEQGSDSLYFDLILTEKSNEYRLIFAGYTYDNNILILTMQADDFIKFKNNTGLEILIKTISLNEDINYIALENNSGIQFQSGKSKTSELDDDYFDKLITDKELDFKIIDNDSLKTFEANRVFYFGDEFIGVLRVGLSMDSYDAIESSIFNRIIISSVILFILITLSVFYVFIKQNYELLKKKYKTIESYSNQIIQNVSDGILMIDEDFKNITNNKAAIDILGSEQEFDRIKQSAKINIESNNYVFETELLINNKILNLLIGVSLFKDENGKLNYILLIKDFTKNKLVTEELKRKERLVAMGELASGVAHEIRNPLNTIATITQQLNKDFEPTESKDEYYKFTQLIYSEIKRINKTINDFLTFARPEPLQKTFFYINELMDEIELQYKQHLLNKQILFFIKGEKDIKVYLDKNKIKQVLINLIRNSEEAIINNGEISIEYKSINEELIIYVEDNGPGVKEDIKEKVFNLYYTTKASGTGLGLTIVQRIIYEHFGTIRILNKDTKGLMVEIKLPQLTEK